MAREHACPNCRIALQVSPSQLGRQVRCPVCGSISTFGTVSTVEPGAAADGWIPISSGGGVGVFGAAEKRSEDPAEPLATLTFDGPGRGPDLGSGGRSPDRAANAPPGPKSLPRARTVASVSRAEEYVAVTASSSFDVSPDRAWWIGLVCGLISLLGGNLVCFCCLLGPFGSTFFAVAGLVATSFSQRGPKAVNFVIGTLGLVISLIMLVLMAVAKLG